MITPASGVLLIADPFLKDPNFARTVVLLCEHRKEGSFGFVMNKLIAQKLEDLITDMEGFAIDIHYGGPVQQDTLHFIHECPELIPGGEPIGAGVYWGGNFETVAALIKNELIDLEKIKFFLGYSGWGDGQLQDELDEKSWLTVQANRKLIFGTRHTNIWKESLLELGGDYAQLINYPLDPQLN